MQAFYRYYKAWKLVNMSVTGGFTCVTIKAKLNAFHVAKTSTGT